VHGSTISRRTCKKRLRASVVQTARVVVSYRKT
jgi:hypothetical protein